jgi:hypothetical protein
MCIKGLDGMKKLALVGTARSIYNLPESGYDIWAAGSVAFSDIKKVDVIFELHKRARIKQSIDEGCFYNRFQCPIYVQDIYEVESLIECPVIFPKDDIIRHFNYLNIDKGYFNSTIAWMLAFAIMQGYEEITLFGIHLSHESEYFYQRPCVEFWIAIALEKGIKVNIPKDSDILNHHYLYGYEDIPIATEKIMSKKLHIEIERRKCFNDYVNAVIILNQMEGMKAGLEDITLKEKVERFFKEDAGSIQQQLLASKRGYDECNGMIEMLEYVEDITR